MAIETSEEIRLTLPDGSTREVPAGTTPLDVAKGIGPGLAKAAVGAYLDGDPIDLRQPLASGGDFRLVTVKSDEAGPFIRHSAEHVLADAVKRLFPEVEIDVGRRDHSEKFQYDFRFRRAFTPEDLEAIEERMREILAEDAEFEREEVSREEARELFASMGENLKVERLADIPQGEPITLFRHGRFVDLCRGPHVQRASQVGAVKLLEASGVYFRGDESGERLQRIYGTAFASPRELEAYTEAIEEARRRDHRTLGAELGLFTFSPHAPASPFFHPKGARVYNLLVDYVRELYEEYGYGETVTPQILDVDLWHRSGHYDNYRDAMFFTGSAEQVKGEAGEEPAESGNGAGGGDAGEGEGGTASAREEGLPPFAVKPMNCPGHCLMFGSTLRSYRDLPVRFADFGRLHRYERSGVTSGLMRVRTFSQDDAHVFCTESQVEEEVLSVVDMLFRVYETFGFEDVAIEISTRPEKSLGTAELWERAEGALQAALARRGVDYEINAGDGAFYGPKIDFQVKDALGRAWQLGTIQLDYQLPERFELTYVGADGEEHRPVLIHRALLGSLERFMGVLIEHLGGNFPVWLAPVQATVLPVSEKFLDYARRVGEELRAAGLRVEVDERNEKLGYKIREAQLAKVPYMLVVGGREEEAGTVAVRLRGGEDLGSMPVAELAERARERMAGRGLEL